MYFFLSKTFLKKSFFFEFLKCKTLNNNKKKPTLVVLHHSLSNNLREIKINIMDNSKFILFLANYLKDCEEESLI